MTMWITNGVHPETGRVRQHDDLSYWMSGDEIEFALGIHSRLDRCLWPVTPSLRDLLSSRRGCELEANFNPGIGTLTFVVERRNDWKPLITATWKDDKIDFPENPAASAQAAGRGVIWHLEGFDRARLFMVEHIELTHRIPESELFAALGNPVDPYVGGFPPTSELVELINTKIGLPVRLDELQYQVNPASRYGSFWPLN